MIQKNYLVMSDIPSNLVYRFQIMSVLQATQYQKNITLVDVQRETGIAWSTLNSWANNQVTRYDAPVIQTLCEYFDCHVGDLLVFEKEKPAI